MVFRYDFQLFDYSLEGYLDYGIVQDDSNTNVLNFFTETSEGNFETEVQNVFTGITEGDDSKTNVQNFFNRIPQEDIKTKIQNVVTLSTVSITSTDGTTKQDNLYFKK